MQILKKISYVLMIVLLLGSQIVLPDFNEVVEAKTLRDLKNELASLEKKYQANKNQQAATQSEISAARAQITRLSQEKEQIAEDIIELNLEIEQLNKDIILKNEEIKEIMEYYQLNTTGDDAYLEYIFTATDFTDFIYRMAIAEQLSDYNSSLVDEYKDMISRNEDMKKRLQDKNIQLTDKISELDKSVSNLQSKLKQAVDGALSIADEIKILKNNIKIYEEDFKCKLDEDLKECEKGKLPPGTAFYRPIVTGRVSSNYGYRTYTLNGKLTTDFHYGLDFSASHGVNVYAVANGRVVATVSKSSCGGNMIYIIHNVNGKKYTSAYYHMASINVKVGQAVYTDTVVGKMGGSPSIETWDKCSTGSHVHLQMATGHYMSDYSAYSSFVANTFNPRNVVNAPAIGVQITGRNVKY